MACLSAAELRDEARGDMLACGLKGFVRIAAGGGPLLVTDALRRADDGQRRALCALYAQNDWDTVEKQGLLWMTPGLKKQRVLAYEAEELARGYKVTDWDAPLAYAGALAVRMLLCPAQPEWTAAGCQLIVETLRLPQPLKTWEEANCLRPRLAEMLRHHDRSGMHEAGAILAARIRRG